jgi:hypothetical protein
MIVDAPPEDVSIGPFTEVGRTELGLLESMFFVKCSCSSVSRCNRKIDLFCPAFQKTADDCGNEAISKTLSPVFPGDHQPDDPPGSGALLHESPDGIADDLPAAFRNEEGIGKENPRLADKDLGLAPLRTILPLKITHRGKILFAILPDDQVHTGVLFIGRVYTIVTAGSARRTVSSNHSTRLYPMFKKRFGPGISNPRGVP